MKQLLFTGAAMLMTLSSASFAQTTPTSTGTPAGTPTASPALTAPANTAVSGPHANGADARRQLTGSLQQAGFTDVKVMADSFLVQAKDKSGHPVTMFLNPDSMTVVTTDGSAGPNAQTNTGGAFANIPAKDELSSKVVGLDVYNGANEDIGTIKDLAFDATGVKAYIVGVGGFLGMGDHYVAVRPSAIALSYDATAKKWHASMNTNADQLKAAPEYKYASND